MIFEIYKNYSKNLFFALWLFFLNKKNNLLSHVTEWNELTTFPPFSFHKYFSIDLLARSLTFST
jgi:hypothetical protein